MERKDLTIMRKLAVASTIGGAVTIAGQLQMYSEYGRSVMPENANQLVIAASIAMTSVGLGVWAATQFLINRAAQNR